MKRFNNIHYVNRVYEYVSERKKHKVVVMRIIFVSRDPFIARIAAVEREVS